MLGPVEVIVEARKSGPELEYAPSGNVDRAATLDRPGKGNILGFLPNLVLDIAPDRMRTLNGCVRGRPARSRARRRLGAR